MTLIPTLDIITWRAISSQPTSMQATLLFKTANDTIKNAYAFAPSAKTVNVTTAILLLFARLICCVVTALSLALVAQPGG